MQKSKIQTKIECFCKECGHRKYLHYLFKSRFCLWCRKKTANDIRVSLSEALSLRESIRVRQKRKGFKKFIRETIKGWFSSKDPKLEEGVDIVRNVDKEKNWYDQVVRDRRTGKIIHEDHEPLNQHKHKIKNE